MPIVAPVVAIVPDDAALDVEANPSPAIEGETPVIEFVAIPAEEQAPVLVEAEAAPANEDIAFDVDFVSMPEEEIAQPLAELEPLAEEILPIAEVVSETVEEPQQIEQAVEEAPAEPVVEEQPAAQEPPASEPVELSPSQIVRRENLRAVMEAKLAPVVAQTQDAPEPEKPAHPDQSALNVELPRVDAWLERRLRVFERALADIEARLEKSERGSQRAEGLVGDNVREMQQRTDAAERRQRENLETIARRVEAAESRHRTAISELRGMMNDAFVKLLDPNAPLPPLANETIAEEPQAAPQVLDTAPAPAEHAFTTEPSQSFLSAARRAANAAAELAEAERQAQGSRAGIWADSDKRKLYTRYLIAGAVMLVMVLMAAGIALRNGASAARTVVPPAAKIAVMHRSVSIVQPATAPLDRLTVLANSGNAKAELIVGLKYLHGDGAQVNAPQAAYWLERAAEAHEPVAQYWYGTLYEHGQGVAKDAAQAAHWYEAAAGQGNLKAMYRLGVAYSEGSDVEKNPAQSVLWFSRAANAGLVDAEFNLAVLYERGQGVPQSLLDAYKWYAVAAAQGDAESKLRMDAIATQLSPDALAAAQAAIQSFKPAPLDEEANVVPEMAGLPVASAQ